MDEYDRYFEILGIPPGSSLDEIKQAYRDLAQVWHPDIFRGKSERLQKKAEEKMKSINGAYERLRDRETLNEKPNDVYLQKAIIGSWNYIASESNGIFFHVQTNYLPDGRVNANGTIKSQGTTRPISLGGTWNVNDGYLRVTIGSTNIPNIPLGYLAVDKIISITDREFNYVETATGKTKTEYRVRSQENARSTAKTGFNSGNGNTNQNSNSQTQSTSPNSQQSAESKADRIWNIVIPIGVVAVVVSIAAGVIYYILTHFWWIVGTIVGLLGIVIWVLVTCWPVVLIAVGILFVLSRTRGR